MLQRYLLTVLFAAVSITGLALITPTQSSANDQRVKLKKDDVQALEKCWGKCRGQHQKDMDECRNKPESERPACEAASNERYSQCKLECIPNL